MGFAECSVVVEAVPFGAGRFISKVWVNSATRALTLSTESAVPTTNILGLVVLVSISSPKHPVSCFIARMVSPLHPISSPQCRWRMGREALMCPSGTSRLCSADLPTVVLCSACLNTATANSWALCACSGVPRITSLAGRPLSSGWSIPMYAPDSLFMRTMVSPALPTMYPTCCSGTFMVISQVRSSRRASRALSFWAASRRRRSTLAESFALRDRARPGPVSCMTIVSSIMAFALRTPSAVPLMTM
mmetsp:Transcript_38849/g.101622  ORF Transcript_38849/g.101622 Transcript_38849/m.101622 type:complete len:247 (+) Transcript_38849:508-1248(+)